MAESNVHPIEEDCCYYCLSCKVRLYNKEIVITYIYSPEKYLECTKCGEFFKSVFMVTQKSSADTPSHRCGNCSLTFGNSTQLLYHSYNHSKDWPHRCPFCNRGFAIASYLEEHNRERNIIRKTYCRKCLKWFQGKCCPGILRQLEGHIYCESCSPGSSPIEYMKS
ncbi:hypothetical protein TNIN_307201 [Trichonephila inaurata madagascariensis]|uniref:C2H2-type domain-containing protein n=1 Tax=Trichonephila inaurata madagascariensis TaxID=2747483 RepID=A0A8X6Y7J4_9ARAC|nr:hypothetical protein TNIN_307201 [Trichonephila inaurata madagascariensis]